MDNGRFYPNNETVQIKGRCKVLVTVLEDTVTAQEETPQAAAWREFFEAVNASDEELPETFERMC